MENQQLVVVHELLVCEIEPVNAVGMYCGSKDGQLTDTNKVVMRLPQITCRY